MPTRVLRDWTDSYNVNGLDWPAEVFFTRLIMKADDYGRFTGDPRLLRSALFPLKDGIRDTDISRWIAMCEKAGLIRVYQATDKPFILIEKFNQRVRAEKSKYPDPSGEIKADAGQLPGMCQTDDRQPRTKAKAETKAKEESKNSPKEKREEKEKPSLEKVAGCQSPVVSGEANTGSCRLPPQSAYVSEERTGESENRRTGENRLSDNLKSSFQELEESGKENQGGMEPGIPDKPKARPAFRSQPKGGTPGAQERIWIASGKTKEEYERLTNPPLPELSEDDKECLSRAEIDLDNISVWYYRRAKALIGEGKFSTLCHEFKGWKIEGRKAKKSYTSWFVNELNKAVSK